MEQSHPFLMTEAEAVSMKVAARRLNVSVDTIRRLNREHRIGRQMKPRSPVQVSLPALIMLRHGDVAAVELLRNGERDHPDVLRYFRLIDG